MTCAFDVVAKEGLLNPRSYKFTHVFTCKILGLFRNFLVVQWLGLRSSTAGGMDSIPGQETKIPQGAQWQKKKKEYELFFLNLDLWITLT